MATRIYASPDDNEKMNLEGKNPEGKTLKKTEGMTATTANTSIKFEMTGDTNFDKKETEPHEMTA